MRTRSNFLVLVEFIVGAMFAIGLMVATVLVSEDDNPIPCAHTRPPPIEMSPKVESARVKGIRAAE